MMFFVQVHGPPRSNAAAFSFPLFNILPRSDLLLLKPFTPV